MDIRPKMSNQEPQNNINHATLDRQLCRDYIRGTCKRAKCKFSHNIHVLSKQSQATRFSPKSILSKLYMPCKGHIFINLNNFVSQQNYNGILICNLNDIIPVNSLEHLLNTGNPNQCHTNQTTNQSTNQHVIDSILSGCRGWADNINKILKWSHNNTDSFNKTNYKMVFMYDVSQVISKWTQKHSGVSNSNLISFIEYNINTLFTCLYEKLPTELFNEMNIIVNYLVDEFSIINRYCIDFLCNMIYSNTDKYVSNTFANNIYYIGNKPDFSNNISTNENKGFVFSQVSGSKYIDLQDILTDNPVSYGGDVEINESIMVYNNYLSAHNLQIYKNLFEKNSAIKQALTTKLTTALTVRSQSLIIMGCNLDVEFDKYILTGLKDVIGSINFADLGQNTKTKSESSAQNGKPDDSKQQKTLCKTDKTDTNTNNCCDDTNATMSIIVPIFSDGSMDGSPAQLPQFNNMMKDLLTSLVKDKSTGVLHCNKPGDNSNVIYNKICTIGLNLIEDIKGNVCVNQPFDTIYGIDKIKEYGLEPNNKIILLASPRMNHTVFQEFISQITRTPEYPIKITSLFIDYDINPSIKMCLAYHYYRTIMSTYLKPSFTEDIPVCQISKLWRKFTNYMNIVKKVKSDTCICTVNTAVLSQSAGAADPYGVTTDKIKFDDSKCCNCCACLSRNGVGYIKFGNFPYIQMEQLTSIKDDSWLPRF